jgi:predicted Zn-ribbon and HTH transcriptional regulator
VAVRKTHEKFIEEFNRESKGEYVVLSQYFNTKTKLLVCHLVCKHIYHVAPAKFLNSGRRCPKCKGGTKVDDYNYRKHIAEITAGEYEAIGEYVNNSTPILTAHKKCGYTWLVRPANIKSGKRCPKCAYEDLSKLKKWTTSRMKKEMERIVGDEYELVSEYEDSQTPVIIKHNICEKEFTVKPAKFMSGNRCSFCFSSSGEQSIRMLLDKHSLKYEAQYRIDECRNLLPLPFDFAVFSDSGEIDFLIEYQGRQHYEPVEVFGGQEQFERQQLHDKIKRDYCVENKIRLIVIPYYEKLDESLIDKLIPSQAV